MEYEVGYGKPPEEAKWKPGVKPEGAGRPLGSLNHSTIIRRFLDETIKIKDKDDDGKDIERSVTIEEAVVLGQLRGAMNGNSKNYNAIMDRHLGKVPQRVELENKDVTQFSSTIKIQYDFLQNVMSMGINDPDGGHSARIKYIREMTHNGKLMFTEGDILSLEAGV